MQQTLLGVFGFATQGDRGEKRSLANFGRGAQTVAAAVEQAANHYQSQNAEKGQTPSNGSAKSDISRWFAQRASSNQSGQGGPAVQQAIIERQDKLLAIRRTCWGSCSKCTPHRPASSEIAACGSKPRKLKSICSALRFARGARCIKSGISFTQRSCGTGPQLQGGPPPRGPLVRAL